jgi:hypothetical protein
MATDTLDAKQHARELIDQLGPSQIDAVVRLLEVMTGDDGDDLTEQDRRAVAASREYFRQGGEGLSLEQIAAGCGLTIDQIRKP